jgi:hypothetical protein
MLGTLELLVTYWGAFDALTNTWNLWRRGALTPEAALEEIGRILHDNVKAIAAAGGPPTAEDTAARSGAPPR